MKKHLDNDSLIYQEITTAGIVSFPLQPAFQAHADGNQSNFAVGNWVDVLFATERFDQNADYDGSSEFTAPVTGKYQINCHLYMKNLDTASTYYQMKIESSNRTYYAGPISPGTLASDPAYYHYPMDILIDMDASDTVKVAIYQATGDVQTDIDGSSHFSGFLAC